MYTTKYHDIDLSKCSFLVTGGAGFIGSNLVHYLLKYNAGKVRVLDNLSNGYYENIRPFLNCENFQFIEGDIRDFNTCVSAVKDMDYVSHQAALGSVPRSIKDPITTNEVNIGGFLNMLTAVKDSGKVKKMVYAASSSSYGDSALLPKIEGNEGKPLSPYAVTKLVNELYADVFSNVYNVHTLGLRYFNVFGPNQNPDNPYAAVIPLFLKSVLNKEQPKINGDGLTARDFTYVANAVQANIKGMLNGIEIEKHEVINIGCGKQTSLLEILDILAEATGTTVKPRFSPERAGDIKYSLASIVKAKALIDYVPAVHFKEGLLLTLSLQKDNQ